MKILIAQMNSTVGAFEENFQKMSSIIEEASDEVDLIVFPECALCGYPQQDLLDFPAFIARSEEYSQKLVDAFPQKSFIFGTVARNEGVGRPVRNVAIFADQGKLVAQYSKRLLPTYDVFDEDRFFEPGRESCIVDFKGKKLGITICEDIWNNELQPNLQNRYKQAPLEDNKTADILINLSASPFEAKKVQAKREMLAGISRQYQKPFVYVNAVGANDSIIFDGRSYLWNGAGELVESCHAFKEETLLIDTSKAHSSEPIHLRNESIEDIYDALVLGIQDYAKKVGFKTAILGLSGGIDSAVITCLAADALGPKNVTIVMMPSRYTSKESNEDALFTAKATQCPLHIFVIEEVFVPMLRTLEKTFEGREPDVTEENIQSRIRGMILMAMSNKFNDLLLTTGNKSELAVGYCTLYGDMNGGLAPLSDVYKTQVYELGREANRRHERISERTFSKPPTAELRENQTDQDHLPPYENLDAVLEDVVENFMIREELLEKGHNPEHVEKVMSFLSRNEYKRYQMPLGLKVTSKAFGVGRRMPLVQKFY
jgi:NAD+ synthetase